MNIKNAYLNSKKNQNDSWAVAWMFSMQYNGCVGVMPKSNLTKNIGFGDDAHNRGRKSSPFAKPYAQEIKFPLKHPNEVKVDLDADAETLEIHFKNGYPYWYVYGSRIYRAIFTKGTNKGIIGWIRRSLRKIVTKADAAN
jgi:hypothetical protein